MPLVPIQEAHQQTGVDEPLLRDWLASGRLTDHSGQVDLRAVTELKRLDDELERITAVQQRADRLETSINELRGNIPAGDPPWYKGLSIAASALTVIIAAAALYVANQQLSRAADAVEAAQRSVEVSERSLRSQTEAIQAQTAYTFKTDLLRTFLSIAERSPGVLSPQEAYLDAYFEQIKIGRELAGGITLSNEFWDSFRSDVCSPWQNEVCADGTPRSKGSIIRQYPAIGELCFESQTLGDNICEVNLEN